MTQINYKIESWYYFYKIWLIVHLCIQFHVLQAWSHVLLQSPSRCKLIICTILWTFEGIYIADITQSIGVGIGGARGALAPPLFVNSLCTYLCIANHWAYLGNEYLSQCTSDITPMHIPLVLFSRGMTKQLSLLSWHFVFFVSCLVLSEVYILQIIYTNSC